MTISIFQNILREYIYSIIYIIISISYCIPLSINIYITIYISIGRYIYKHININIYVMNERFYYVMNDYNKLIMITEIKKFITINMEKTKMEVKNIDFNDFSGRGIWKQEALQAFVEEHAKPKTAISVPIMEFYKNFYAGSKVIKYVNYYCKKHIEEALTALSLKGLVQTSGNMLKIRFD